MQSIDHVMGAVSRDPRTFVITSPACLIAGMRECGSGLASIVGCHTITIATTGEWFENERERRWRMLAIGMTARCRDVRSRRQLRARSDSGQDGPDDMAGAGGSHQNDPCAAQAAPPGAPRRCHLLPKR